MLLEINRAALLDGWLHIIDKEIAGADLSYIRSPRNTALQQALVVSSTVRRYLSTIG